MEFSDKHSVAVLHRLQNVDIRRSDSNAHFPPFVEDTVNLVDKWTDIRGHGRHVHSVAPNRLYRG